MRINATETPVNTQETAQTQTQKKTTEKMVTVTVPSFYEYIIMYNDGTTSVHTTTERIPVATVRKDLKKSDEKIADVFFRGQQTKKVEVPLSVISQYINK